MWHKDRCAESFETKCYFTKGNSDLFEGKVWRRSMYQRTVNLPELPLYGQECEKEKEIGKNFDCEIWQ